MWFLYALPSSDFHDATTGYNGYSAVTGYDLVTGLGSPKASQVIAGMLAIYGISETTTATSATYAAATTTTATSTSKGSWFDQTTSTTVGSGAALGTPPSLGGTVAGVSALSSTTSLAAGGQGAGTLSVQALITQASSAQVQPASQHAAASTAVSQGTASTSNSLPGQSLLEDSTPLSRLTASRREPRPPPSPTKRRGTAEDTRPSRGADAAPGRGTGAVAGRGTSPCRLGPTGFPPIRRPSCPRRQTTIRRSIPSTWHSSSSA